MLDDKTLTRLNKAPVIWMTTVRSDGQPQSSVVWFIVEEGEILVYSKKSIRVSNVENRSRVALNLNSTEWGGSVLSIEGQARVEPDLPAAKDNPAYMHKYEGQIRSYKWTPESFSRDYPVPIRISVDRVRVW